MWALPLRTERLMEWGKVNRSVETTENLPRVKAVLGLG